MSRYALPMLVLLLVLMTGACAGHRMRAPLRPVPPPAETVLAVAAPVPAMPMAQAIPSEPSLDELRREVQLDIDRRVASELRAHEEAVRKSARRAHGFTYEPHPHNDAFVAALRVDTARIRDLNRAYDREIEAVVASIKATRPVTRLAAKVSRPAAKRRPSATPPMAVRATLTVPSAVLATAEAPIGPKADGIAEPRPPASAQAAPEVPPPVPAVPSIRDVTAPPPVAVLPPVRPVPVSGTSPDGPHLPVRGNAYDASLREGAMAFIAGIAALALIVLIAWRWRARKRVPRPTAEDPDDSYAVAIRALMEPPEVIFRPPGPHHQLITSSQSSSAAGAYAPARLSEPASDAHPPTHISVIVEDALSGAANTQGQSARASPSSGTAPDAPSKRPPPLPSILGKARGRDRP